MDSTTIVVMIMGLAIVAIGAFIALASKPQRPIGVIIIALGVMLIVAFFMADDEPPPGTFPTPGATPATPAQEVNASFKSRGLP